MHLQSIAKFRGVAIVFVLASHCYPLAGLSFVSYTDRFLQTLITGGTSFFVFISGFLFYHVFFPRYGFRKFMRGKARKLVIPYLLLSIPPIIVLLHANARAQNLDWVHAYALPIVKSYALGWAHTTYWYIPFVMAMFALSPLHYRFVTLRLSTQLAITAVLFVVALFVQRPLEPGFIPQALVYFTPVYLIGILCAMHKDAIWAALKGREVILVALALAAAVLEVAVGRHGNYNKNPFDYGGVDLMLVQKTILCIAMMVWLHRFEATKNRTLDLLAATSFSLFFINPYVISFLFKIKLHFGLTGLTPWAAFCVASVLVVLFSVSIAVAVKKAVPKYSAYLTGY